MAEGPPGDLTLDGLDMTLYPVYHFNMGPYEEGSFQVRDLQTAGLETASHHLGAVKPYGTNKPMNTPKIGGGRALKKRVFELLKSNDNQSAMDALRRLPARQVINPLFALLNHKDPGIKWAAVTAAGAVVADLANHDLEGARNIMRRIMWNLNDESGGIGWGLPELMGEILSRQNNLADEYTRILVSYTNEETNYLEHEGLQRGLLWGIGRLAQVEPRRLRDASSHLMRYLDSPDAPVRGHAAWVMGLLLVGEARPQLKRLMGDESEFQIYLNRSLKTRRVCDAAAVSLKRLSKEREDL